MTYRPATVDDEETVEFKVRIDLKTVAWLMGLCELHRAPPATVIAAIVSDVREDDEFEHDEGVRVKPNAPSTATHN